jgi:hypothetical protein
LVNPVQFREALNHLRDILFARLKKGPTSSRPWRDSVATKGRYENDRKRENRAHQEHG